jgi:hypothetical protein
MPNNHQTNRTLGWLALSLFIGGLLGPIVLFVILKIINASEETQRWVPLVFAAIAQVLALPLGIIAWRQITGKIGAIGAGILVTYALFLLLSRFAA